MAEFFSRNLKFLREQKGLSQSKLAEKIGVNQTTIARWEDDNRVPTIDNAIDVADALNISLPDLLGKDLRIDDSTIINLDNNTVSIPVLGIIKAGIPIEAQENIIEYIEIPKIWTKGNKKFFGLKIDGDSMFPKYQTDDIVVFEQNCDIESANNKDCAVMVNGDDATFKKIMISEKGLTLIPYNAEYEPLFFTINEAKKLPIRIIGIAREKRTRV